MGSSPAAKAEKGLISVSTELIGKEVELRIRDNGSGIPKAVAGRIYHPFFTTKPVGKGTGQGLAIARSVVVDKHPGSIRFESELGAGICFFRPLANRWYGFRGGYHAGPRSAQGAQRHSD